MLPPDFLPALHKGVHDDPFNVLGKQDTWRVWNPRVTTVAADNWIFESAGPGLFIGHPQNDAAQIGPYHDQDNQRRYDPYCFGPMLSEFDLARFAAGDHLHLERVLGAIPTLIDDIPGTRFAVWAPNAAAVSVIGNWNDWQENALPMRRRHEAGVWELFVPGVEIGDLYQFSIVGADGQRQNRCDPYARQVEAAPGRAAIVAPELGEYRPAKRQPTPPLQAMSIYEVHAASWRLHPDGSLYSYRDLAEPLATHARAHGFTHIEFLPLAVHPLPASWGYQVTGQWAVDPRLGTPEDFRFLIQHLHQAGLGVFIDFVPGHFPKDAWALADFDGSPTYEYTDPREGEHKTWGTKVYNFRRPEVVNFLTGAALYWLRTFGLDGIRIDAVSSMLYRNYDREDGEWIANEDGSHENHDAVAFLQHFTGTIEAFDASVMLVAEESTAWPNITQPAAAGGLGFHRKWNMGWMHDSLRYFSADPVMRSGTHNDATFHQWYAYDEKWVLALSHDEVVHGKRSLLGRLPGDYHQQLAHMRLLFAWQLAVPGVPLLFMGGEFGQGPEWDALGGLPWHEAQQPERQALSAFHGQAQQCYRAQPALWQADDEIDGFIWIDSENAQESVLAFVRAAADTAPILVVANFTPVPRPAYPLGVPWLGSWELLLDSSEARWSVPGSPASEPRHEASVPGNRGAWGADFVIDLPPLTMQWWRLNAT